MEKSIDVAIIGGGIIGNALAFFLAKEGISVALLEAGKIASRTTKAAAGMLGAHSEYTGNQPFYTFAKESQSLYEEFIPQVEELSGFTIERVTGGILQYQSAAQEPTHSAGVHISPQAIKQAIPQANVPMQGGILFKEDVHVHPERTCLAFCKAAQVLGANIYEYTPVHSITDGMVVTESGEIQAQHIVVTAGNSSKDLLPLAMTAVKGQCLKLDGRELHLPFTLFRKGTYMLQRADSTIVVGATMEENAKDGITAEGQEKLLDIAESFLVGSSRLPVLDRWYGFRPKTIDELPYIGNMPNGRNLLVATGHFRNGILLAPATAKMIQDLILGRTINPEYLEVFKPERGILVNT